MPTVAIGYVIEWKDPDAGSRVLADITNVDISDSDSAETIYDVAGNAIGSKRSRSSSSISMTQRVNAENEGIPDWLSLKLSGATCRLTKSTLMSDDTVGRRVHYDVKVSSVSESSNNTGDVERSIELTILDEKVQ